MPPARTISRLTSATVGTRSAAARAERRAGIQLVLAMVAVMWVLEVLNSLDHQALDRDGGLIARHADRLWAIFTSPFLHVTFTHLIDNTIPFLVMGVLIALRGATRVALVSAIVIVVGGLGTWLTAPANSLTVGASGLVFGYAAYLLTRGFFDHSLRELLVGAVVAVIWGTALLSSLVPRYGISWQGHAFGAVGGALAAYLLAGTDARRRSSGSGTPGAARPSTATSAGRAAGRAYGRATGRR